MTSLISSKKIKNPNTCTTMHKADFIKRRFFYTVFCLHALDTLGIDDTRRFAHTKKGCRRLDAPFRPTRPPKPDPLSHIPPDASAKVRRCPEGKIIPFVPRGITMFSLKRSSIRCGLVPGIFRVLYTLCTSSTNGT